MFEYIREPPGKLGFAGPMPKREGEHTQMSLSLASVYLQAFANLSNGEKKVGRKRCLEISALALG